MSNERLDWEQDNKTDPIYYAEILMDIAKGVKVEPTTFLAYINKYFETCVAAKRVEIDDEWLDKVLEENQNGDN